MKKSQKVYVDRCIEKIGFKPNKLIEPKTVSTIIFHENHRKGTRRYVPPHMIIKPERKSKDYHLNRIELNGKIAVDCEGCPPSKLFNKEIKKGLLKRIRVSEPGYGRNFFFRRTYITKVVK